MAKINTGTITTNGSGNWTSSAIDFVAGARRAYMRVNGAQVLYRDFTATGVGKIVTVGPNKTYASLQAAITGEVAAQADLTATDGTLNIVLYDVDDTTAANVTGFTTDSTHYVNIYCAPTARHAGVWDGAKYNLAVNNGNVLTVGQAYTRISGLQVSIDQYVNDIYGIYVTADNVRVSGCVVRSTQARDHTGIIAFENTNITTAFYAWNNVIYDCGAIGLMTNPNSSATSYIYNNTFYGNSNAIYSNRTAVFKNNLFAAQTTATFSDSGTSTGSNYNSTSSAAWGSTYTPGANDQAVSRTFTFTNAAGKDFSLTTGDAGAYQLGVDLSADAALPFSDNAAGVARTGSWNIGAL